MIQPYTITVGSLIRTNKGEIAKVESISTERQQRKVGYYRDNDMYHLHYVGLSQCEGIPLTKEILNDNGAEPHAIYESDEKHMSLVFYNELGDNTITLARVDSDGNITDYWNDGICFVVLELMSQPITYIHELQDILNICGLHDRADKFIVRSI